MNSHHVKVVLLGHQGVGKSSIERRYVTRRIEERPKTTLSLDFTTKEISVENQMIQLRIWDTWGQERFRALTSSYYRGAQAAIVVYDVTDENTYNKALDWIQELRQNCDHDSDKAEVVVALVGNKVDLAKNSRAVLAEDVSSYASENGMLFAETSAKSGMGVDDLFLKVAREVASRCDLEAMSRERDAMRLPRKEENKGSWGCC